MLLVLILALGGVAIAAHAKHESDTRQGGASGGASGGAPPAQHPAIAGLGAMPTFGVQGGGAGGAHQAPSQQRDVGDELIDAARHVGERWASDAIDDLIDAGTSGIGSHSEGFGSDEDTSGWGGSADDDSDW